MARKGGPPFAMEAVCFDLLTALLDSWSLWDAVAAEAGYQGQGRRWRQAYLRITSAAGDYRPYEAIIAEAAREAGLPPALAGRLLARWGEAWPWPEVPAALRALRLPLAVATNCSEALAGVAVATLEVTFAVVATAERAGAYKPDPRPYRLALAGLGLPPGRVLFVAGSPFDVGGALGAGLPVVWANRLGLPPPPGAEAATVVDDLRGLPALIAGR